MSILNVNTIQPVGSGQTITVSAADISAPSTVITASSFTGNLTGNVTGNVTGVVTSSSGNLTISNGNLVFSTAGTGIDFSATTNSSGTMSSELLSDYEEGTWTPTVYGSSSAGTTTYTIQAGVYTKIGRQVTTQATIRYTATTGSGLLLIGGFPFSFPVPTRGCIGAVEVSGLNWSAGTHLVIAVEEGASYGYIFCNGDDVDRTTQSITNEIAVIQFTLTYYV